MTKTQIPLSVGVVYCLDAMAVGSISSMDELIYLLASVERYGGRRYVTLTQPVVSSSSTPAHSE